MPKRIAELDGLRGVAILLVVFYHYFVQHAPAQPGSPWAYTLKYLSYSSWGVDLFFVLSGFLIGGILLDNRNAPNYFSTFYLRRTLRIVPLYALFLGAFAIALAWRPSDRAADWLLGQPFPLWTYALYVQNFFMAAEGRFGPNFAGITWSLAVEEQFYVLFPLLVRLCSPLIYPIALVLLVLLAPLYRAWLVVTDPAMAVPAGLLLPARADALLLGAIAAWFVRNESMARLSDDKWKKLRNVLLFSALLAASLPVLASQAFRRLVAQLDSGFVADTALGARFISEVFGYTLFAAASATLLILLTADKIPSISRILANRLLIYIGTLSYSIYLFHQAIHGFLAYTLLDGSLNLDTAASWGVMLLSVLLTVLFAHLTWHAFEARLIKLGHQYLYHKEGAWRGKKPIASTT